MGLELGSRRRRIGYVQLWGACGCVGAYEPYSMFRCSEMSTVGTSPSAASGMAMWTRFPSPV